jgi:hypothetical protein
MPPTNHVADLDKLKTRIDHLINAMLPDAGDHQA